MQITITLTQEQIDALNSERGLPPAEWCQYRISQSLVPVVAKYKELIKSEAIQKILDVTQSDPAVIDDFKKFVDAPEEVKTQIRDALANVKVVIADSLSESDVNK